MSSPRLEDSFSLPVATPLFVVGCDRSGTTLLTTLMETGLGLAVPLETHFIPYFAKTLFLWGDLHQRHNRQRLLRAIYHFLEILVLQAHPQKEIQMLRPVTLLATLPEAEAIVDGSDGFGTLIGQLFARFAAMQGRSGWLDNSSFYESIPLETWRTHLPDMKVIHIVRDGRDVALSWLQAWWGPASLGEAARLWRDHVQDKRAWGLAHPGHYLEVSYETLLDDPQGVLSEIAAFLELELRTAALDGSSSPMARILSTGGTHDLLTGPVLATNKEKWRRAMAVSGQRLFEFIAGPCLQSSGYPVGSEPFSALERAKRAVEWRVTGWKRFFSGIYYAKKVKWLVPVVLRVAGPWGGWIVRFLQTDEGGVRR